MSNISRPTVCVVGAGPAGLVAAKTLKGHGGFDVTVFEEADCLGGMWRGGEKCSPEMRTNLSRFTVSFADLSWSAVDLSEGGTGSASTTPPMFPKAWQVKRYLEAYSSAFGLAPITFLNTKVIEIDLLGGGYWGWKVEVENTTTKQQSCFNFDFLVIASGFFGKPGKSFDPSPSKDSSNITHSSQFRSIASIAQEPGRIAVIGGGISGSEAAAQAAFQISHTRHSPGATKPAHSDSKIYHITNRPFYCLPRHLPRDPERFSDGTANPSPSFLPLDLVLYNLSRRPDGAIRASIGEVPPEQAEKGHRFMRTALGGDQEDYGHDALVYSPDQLRYPAYCGITDTYMEFVRSGLIVPVQGRVDAVAELSGRKRFSITLEHKQPWATSSKKTTAISTLEEVSGIIEATGFKTDLGFMGDFGEHFLEGFKFCSRVPYLLTRGGIFSQYLSTLGFVGFYEGPYWGIMEMQAQVIAKTWSAATFDRQPNSWPDRDFYKHAVNERVRHAIHWSRSLQVPQFSMGDYIGLMEELAREAEIERDDKHFGVRAGPVVPSRYHLEGTSQEPSIVLDELSSMLEATKDEARFVAPAVFRGMQGVWALTRKIDSRNETAPGGTFDGIAHFHPRSPTSCDHTAEYLYVEEGIFRMDNGYTFPATRRYVYRYNDSNDKITAWFVGEDNKSVGNLFNTWDFHAPEDDNQGWMAKGIHWCDPDTYRNTCEFRFKGASIETFSITYQVEGPDKDYTHESWYRRPEKGTLDSASADPASHGRIYD